MRPKKIPNAHPGEILNEEFLIPLNISMYRLAKDINVSAIRISEIVRGKRSITPDTAIRLGAYFKISPELWIGLQADYDMEETRDRKEAIVKQVKPYKALPKTKIKAIVKHSLRKIALHR